MSKARITIIELDGLDADSEFGLIRTLRDLLEGRGVAVVSTSPAAPASDDPVDPVAASRCTKVDEPQSPAAAAATRRAHVRTQEEIESIIIDTLQLDPAINLEVLAAKAYGADDKRAKTKLTWTLKGLATRGLVERLSASSWRVLAADDSDLDASDEGDSEESSDDEELELE